MREAVPSDCESKTTFFRLPLLSAIIKKMLVLCVSFHFVVLAPPNCDWSLQYRLLDVRD